MRPIIGAGISDVVDPGAQSASAREPCAGSGEETASGSIFYSDRRSTTRVDGALAYLCSDRVAQVHAARKVAPVTDDDLRIIPNNGVMVGVGLLGSGSV